VKTQAKGGSASKVGVDILLLKYDILIFLFTLLFFLQKKNINHVGTDIFNLNFLFPTCRMLGEKKNNKKIN
jgi:hypothetical protein